FIEIDGVTIGHDAAMEGNKEALLVGGIDGRDGAEAASALGYEESLVVVGIDVGAEHGVHGAGGGGFDAVREDGFEYGTGEYGMQFPGVAKPRVPAWILGSRRGCRLIGRRLRCRVADNWFGCRGIVRRRFTLAGSFGVDLALGLVLIA